ncbi:hypothetical protein HW555_001865 [Spodoptera exigua]|uniref:Uncharacterized protein n=1 Tax=Spodoptera exigua TaxID=7107 RepID=A0A835LEX6_SPOEX|nr:hypothetical protein HW555_001865 [Spodoptera exigua]
MYLNRVHRTFPKLKKLLTRQQSQAALVEQNEYTDTPEYPPILDMSLQGKKLRERQELHRKIQAINTVEEKQIALNMPRYYGWKCILFNEDKVPYNAMPLVQYYTRSHFIPIDKLPEYYNETGEAADAVVQEIKDLIEEAILIENGGVDRKFVTSTSKKEQPQLEDALAKCIVKQINRIITNNLSDKVEHVLSSQIDYDPRHEAFWFIGGVDTPINVLRWRQQYGKLRDRWYEPIDRPVQYKGTPILTVRNRLPLKPILPFEEAENPEFKVPKFTAEPYAVSGLVTLMNLVCCLIMAVVTS